MEMSGDIQEDPEMGGHWRSWHMDDRELVSDDEAEVGVWMSEQMWYKRHAYFQVDSAYERPSAPCSSLSFWSANPADGLLKKDSSFDVRASPLADTRQHFRVSLFQNLK